MGFPDMPGSSELERNVSMCPESHIPLGSAPPLGFVTTQSSYSPLGSAPVPSESSRYELARRRRRDRIQNLSRSRTRGRHHMSTRLYRDTIPVQSVRGGESRIFHEDVSI